MRWPAWIGDQQSMALISGARAGHAQAVRDRRVTRVVTEIEDSQTLESRRQT
jgi:hypothetical protein